MHFPDAQAGWGHWETAAAFPGDGGRTDGVIKSKTSSNHVTTISSTVCRSHELLAPLNKRQCVHRPLLLADSPLARLSLLPSSVSAVECEHVFRSRCPLLVSSAFDSQPLCEILSRGYFTSLWRSRLYSLGTSSPSFSSHSRPSSSTSATSSSPPSPLWPLGRPQKWHQGTYILIYVTTTSSPTTEVGSSRPAACLGTLHYALCRSFFLLCRSTYILYILVCSVFNYVRFWSIGQHYQVPQKWQFSNISKMVKICHWKWFQCLKPSRGTPMMV